MYRIMIADDEGIVLQSLKMIIEKNFGHTCEVETVKTGRAVIELAHSFRPDIALMDIQMPGINGIDAIEEVQKFSKSTYFAIISAYDKFDYAKKAIDLGVVEYLTKPFNKDKVVAILEKMMKMVDEDRHNRQVNLRNREKLETVVPIIESGMIYTILFQEDYSEQTQHFKQLLDIEEDYGFMMVIEFGDEIRETNITNPIGATVKAQKFYVELREIVKEFFKGYVGSIIVNKVVVFVPYGESSMDFGERIKVISKARDMIHKLRKHIDAAFKVGIGSVYHMEQLQHSYKEAIKAMKVGSNSVSHIQDIVPQQASQHVRLDEIEKQVLCYLKKRNFSGYLGAINNLYDTLSISYEQNATLFRMKLMETLVVVQREAKEQAGRMVEIQVEEIERLLQCSLEELRQSYQECMEWLYEDSENKQEAIYSDLVMQAKAFIDQNYYKDINLESISQIVNISPYYFSKVFKEETAENFIDYITRIRMEKAKEALRAGTYSIKEICINVGYRDPNYFSRLFKKHVGLTPTEYREGI